MALRPKNWDKFQHYKQRCPPWIKVYRTLLDDRDFMCLPVASKALAVMLWLLASEHTEGVIEGVPADWSFRLRMTDNELLVALKPLIDNGMFEDASMMLAECLQDACPEREGEERDKGQKQKKNGARAPRVLAEDLELPFGINQPAWQEWLSFRRERKFPVSVTVLRKHLNLLAPFDAATQQAMIDSSISSSWQGLFAPKGVKPAAGGAKPPMPPMLIDGVWNPEHKAWMEKYS